MSKKLLIFLVFLIHFSAVSQQFFKIDDTLQNLSFGLQTAVN